MPQDQVASRVFSHHCWMVALIGQSVGVLNCLCQIFPLIRPTINSQRCYRFPESAPEQRRIPGFLRIQWDEPVTNTAFASRCSPSTMAKLSAIVLVLPLFVPFSCIAFTSCFLLLSFISLVPFLQLSSPRHPQVRSHALFVRPILHSLFHSPPSPLLLLSSRLLFPLTVSYTLTMFSLVPPSETHCVFKFRCISYAPLSPFCVWFLRCICIRVVSC